MSVRVCVCLRMYIVAFVATILGPIPKPPQGLERVTVLDYKTAC